jgi:hypothetical protein
VIFGWLVLAALGAYRMAWLITQERGPFDLALRLRNHFTEDDWWGHGLRCVYCVSFWLSVGGALLVLSIFPPRQPVQEFFLLWFGVAGLILPLDRYWHR